MKSILTIALISMTGLFAHAESSKQCWNKASSTVDINRCASMDYVRAKERLDRVTKNLVTTLKEVSAESEGQIAAQKLLTALEGSEVILDRASDIECTFDSEMLGGTADTAEMIGCKTKRLKQRTSRFNSLIKVYKTEDKED